MALERSEVTETYQLASGAFGDPNATDPLERLSWQDLREEIYGEAQSRR